MPPSKENLRVCKQGHRITKAVIAQPARFANKHANRDSGFLALLAAPARRALENAGISTLKQLSSQSETEILMLHGMGPGSMPNLRKALAAEGLSFRKT